MEDMCYESGTLEEPGTLTQGAPVFPGSSRSGHGNRTQNSRVAGSQFVNFLSVSFAPSPKRLIPTNNLRKRDALLGLGAQET